MTSEEREMLFERHEFLIPKMAQKFLNYRKTGVEYDDLYQEAALGLHLAATEFDPAKWEGKSFEKFAVTRIFNSMMPWFARQNLLHSSAWTIATATKIKKCGLINEPVEVIAEKLNRATENVEAALQHLRGAYGISLDAKIDFKDGPKSIFEVIPDKNNICELEHATLQIFRGGLQGKEKAVFELLLQEKTQLEIGEIMNFSRTYAGLLSRQVRNKFLEYSRVV